VKSEDLKSVFVKGQTSTPNNSNGSYLLFSFSKLQNNVFGWWWWWNM